ncbi:MAG: DM13 domain-containing protein [Leptolyngbyaceae cyanobacterium CSU_1_4]|nr:DM13 domain-containing protein [Leptolyngbyaceae cyanobacterium CSU_1_4]
MNIKIRYWLTLGIVSVAVISCTRVKTVSSPQAQETPTVQASAIPNSQAQEAPAVQASAISGQTIRSGTFVSAEHPTEGTVRLITQNNQSSLELDQNFKTSENGPDLVLILHRSADVIGSTQPPTYPLAAEDYVVLAPLQKFEGAQSYPIPDNVNLTDYQSAVIWCRQFNATFGAAVLR